MATMHANSECTTARHSDELLACVRKIRPDAATACQRSVACREMATQARTLADGSRVLAEGAGKRQDDR
jgi:hypothetical protein